MVLRKYTAEPEATAAELLEFICDAFDAGEGAAVEKSHLGLLNDIACCSCSAGDFEGCYVFSGIAERSRTCAFFDKILALVAVLVLSPLLVLIFLSVLLMDGVPVVFRQKRFGVDNAPFDIYKFRTMVKKGEKLHGRLQRRWGKDGQLFKMDKDPRATRLGSVLRATYLDELPQLFNVLKGDMRLCGPRPLPESDNHHYAEKYHSLRLRGVPGITGLWQIKRGSDVSFDEMCLLDLYYLCNNSLYMDLKILFGTVKLLFTSKAAARTADKEA